MQGEKSLYAAGMLIFLLLVLLLQSCVISTKKDTIVSDVHSLFAGTYKVDPDFDKYRPRSVAILPFTDKSRSQKGVDTVRKGFYNHFSSLPYSDMEIYRVDLLLKKAGLSDSEAISKMSPQELGKILRVDAVIYGEVSNFDKIFAVMYSQVSTGAEVKMYDTKTGHFLWRGQHVTRIHQGGVSTTPVGIIATVISASLNLRDIQLLRACDDLFRDMVKTIPAPTIAEAARPPSITLLTQDTKGLPRKAGDEIRVVIQGTPKMTASFDIGDFRKEIEMEELEPGGYLGVYRVVPGDNINEALIIGHLSDEAGNTAQWIDAVGKVTLDTEPPAEPRNVQAVGRDQAILLNWDKNSEEDLAGYRVYRSSTPLSGFEEITHSEFNYYKDEKLVNFQKYFYRVSAFDKVGNESKKLVTVPAIPVAAGPTEVGGVIEENVTWYSGAGPYILKTDVVVREGALLRIEAGTVVEAKGTGITVEGKLEAVGDEVQTILFQGFENGTWKGIVFSNVRDKENRLKFCHIRDAVTGVECLSSSPVIEKCEFITNDEGINVSGAFSAPEIRDNMVHKNRCTGIAVVQGGHPLIEKNKIRNNAQGGVSMISSEPVIQHNTIVQNQGWGLKVENCQPLISGNTLYDNVPLNMVAPLAGQSINARHNWWGTTKMLDILATVTGRVDVSSVLDGPYPEGKAQEMPVLGSLLGGILLSDSYLILSSSPYQVKKDVVIDGGATLFVEPGVEILFDQNTSIVTRDGAVIAKGRKDQPIVFTASAASPAPGFYMSAVRFAGQKPGVNSFLEYCIMEYATIALDIHYGAPEISHCYIAHNAQNGVYCRNDTSANIFYNTFENNFGEGALKCVGMSRPIINFNNFTGNVMDVQVFSTITVDARHNWWGEAPPDMKLIWGTNIDIEPWAVASVSQAFQGKGGRE